jgi:hypothetical protein
LHWSVAVQNRPSSQPVPVPTGVWTRAAVVAGVGRALLVVILDVVERRRDGVGVAVDALDREAVAVVLSRDDQADVIDDVAAVVGAGEVGAGRVGAALRLDRALGAQAGRVAHARVVARRVLGQKRVRRVLAVAGLVGAGVIVVERHVGRVGDLDLLLAVAGRGLAVVRDLGDLGVGSGRVEAVAVGVADVFRARVVVVAVDARAGVCAARAAGAAGAATPPVPGGTVRSPGSNPRARGRERRRANTCER